MEARWVEYRQGSDHGYVVGILVDGCLIIPGDRGTFSIKDQSEFTLNDRISPQGKIEVPGGVVEGLQLLRLAQIKISELIKPVWEQASARNEVARQMN